MFIDDDLNDDDDELVKNGHVDHYDHPSSQPLLYVKTVKESEDFKLKCLATGKPVPTVSWYLKYQYGSTASKLG